MSSHLSSDSLFCCVYFLPADDRDVVSWRAWNYVDTEEIHKKKPNEEANYVLTHIFSPSPTAIYALSPQPRTRSCHCQGESTCAEFESD